jgi:hypothetical protein
MREFLWKLISRIVEALFGKKSAPVLTREAQRGATTQATQTITAQGVTAVQTGPISMGDVHAPVIIGVGGSPAALPPEPSRSFVKVSQMYADIEKLPLFQKSDAIKRLIGQCIDEVGKLYAAEPGDNDTAHLAVVTSDGGIRLWMDISVLKHPEVQHFPDGQILRVRGRIEKAATRTLHLSEARISIADEHEHVLQALPDVGERVFLNRSLASAVEEVSDRTKTSLEKTQIATSKYIGKWVCEEFVYTDLSDYGQELCVGFKPRAAGPREFDIRAYFGKSRLANFSHRQIGEIIRIRGRIEALCFYEVKLADCELIEKGG